MFEPGQSGNPRGRPKGSYGGRIQALAGLDRLLTRKKNQRALIAALERDLQKDPVRFFKTVIMPLLPRESKLSFDHEGVIQWRSLVGGGGDSGQLAGGSRQPGLAAAGMAMDAADEDAGVIVDVEAAEVEGPGMAAEDRADA